MKLRNAVAAVAALSLAALVFSGCPSAGIYRSAKTLEKGESDFGLTFTASRITVTTDTGNETVDNEDYSLTVPNLIPELNFHMGVMDNLEVGGRIALATGLIEIDAKYRFLHLDKFHMAVQPALGYRALFLVQGLSATLPLLATYELTDMISVNLFGYGSYIDYSAADKEFDDLAANQLVVGGGAGIRFEGETFYIMPLIDFSTTASDFKADDETLETTMTTMLFGVNFGWIGGREMKKLKSMDEKLDRIEQKLDNK